MQIGEVAARTELSLRTIRHYEETGLVIPSARSQGGFRLYTETDVARLMVIRRMKPLGFTLEQMRDLLDATDRLDGTYDLGPGPQVSNDLAQERYAYSRCMTCGCCLEACPQYGEDNYIGPQAVAQARLFNMHPTGKMTAEERLNGLMGDDGITNCGNAQNCVKVCPMSIPLTKAIYETNRDITVDALFGWLRK
jgi:succinate dehydrogenase/fumarate reductase-like Fe-S protein